jgi:hypothetical protein
MLVPTDFTESKHTILYDIVNRGNRVVTGWNIGGSATAPGDGF